MTHQALGMFFARAALGLMFLMTGIFRVFELGAVEHARRFFVGPYAETFLPAWSLWAVGTTIPFVELFAGAFMLFGYRVREAAMGIGGVLLIVIFGHMLTEPFFAFDGHVTPRLLLLLVVLLVPRQHDWLSVDAALKRASAVH
jgi:uncharacterized membrane protein YphA (DoxX/SURF4 family)